MAEPDITAPRPGPATARDSMRRLPSGLGLLWYVPQWAAMTVLAVAALVRSRRPRHRDAAAAVLCMTGCAAAAFIPPAFFAGISATRHMVGMNLAAALAFVASVALAVSTWQKPADRFPDSRVP
jgi:hypothetical protein